MNHYKSWAGLNKQLTDLLCDELKVRLSYFLARYHKVHNSYGRAAIRLDNREMVCFSWIEMYRQDNDLHEVWEETGVWDDNDPDLKRKWDADAAYHDMDFLSAATSFLQMPIMDALYNDNCIIRIFAILDRRIGKRTLHKIKEDGAYQSYPSWVKQFYELRLEMLNFPDAGKLRGDNGNSYGHPERALPQTAGIKTKEKGKRKAYGTENL